MTKDIIMELKSVQKALAAVDLRGEDEEEREKALRKLEEVADYLRDAIGKGIEF